MGKAHRVPFGINLYRFRQKYIKCFSREDYDTLIRTVLSNTDSMMCFRSSLMCGSLQNLIGSLFIWTDTPQGNDYWCRIDRQWDWYLDAVS